MNVPIKRHSDISRLLLFLVLVAAALLLVACQQPSTVKATPDKPATIFNAEKFTGGRIYSIDKQESDMDIYIYRAGALESLGHNHIISAHNITGNIYRHTDLEKSGVVMQLPVNDLEVDNADKRRKAGAGFSSIPSDKDIQGTRKNMLGPHQLNADEFPEIGIRSAGISGTQTRPDIKLRITIKGDHHYFVLPATVEYKENKMIINGNTRLRQTELGIEPFSILMGAIAVQNEMDIRFHIVAELSL